MKIDFDSPTHERLANDIAALSKRYNKTKGVDSATAIVLALNVLKAADSLADVPASYRPHPLKGKYKGCFAADVDKVHRIMFRPNHHGDPAYRIDAHKTIKNILILELFKDYHKS